MSPILRAARRTFASLSIRNYRLYFFSQLVSMTGTWIQIVAEGWLVYQLTGSGLALGTVTGLNFAPLLVGGAWAGVLADRLDRRKVIISTQVAAGLLAALLGIVTATGIVELWMVYAIALARGAATAIEVPARQSFVMEMVGPAWVANAVGLNTSVFTSARVAGPAIAAALIAGVGMAPSFFINAATFLAVIVALVKMDGDRLFRTAPVPRSKRQVREGLAYAWNQPVLKTTLLMMAVIGTFAYNFRVFLPLLASDVFGGGAATYGILSAVVGGGTLIGALVAAARARPTLPLLAGSAVSFGVFTIAAGVAPSLAWEYVAMVPLGLASMTFIATANATLQLNSSDAMRGRVMALWAIVFLGSTPIGGPIVGLLAEAIGTRATLAMAGVLTLATGLAVAWTLAPRRWRGARVPAGGTLAEDPAVARKP